MHASRSIDRVRRSTPRWIPALAIVGALVHAPTAASSIASARVRRTEKIADERSAPELPLPRMPGMTKLSSSSRFDAATNTWTLKAAFRVNAHVPHVLAFYRKALADAELEVEETAPSVDDEPWVLLGRNDRVRAQVGIRTKPHELEARVWVFWRVRA